MFRLHIFLFLLQKYEKKLIFSNSMLLLFEFYFQTNYQHSAWRVEGVLPDTGVNAVVHLVEDVIYADAWRQVCPFANIEVVGGMEIPDTISRGILIIACIVSLRL